MKNDQAEAFFADLIQRPAIVLKIQEQVPDWELAEHQHLKSQFLITFSGLITIETGDGIWMVPPNTAIWIPPHVMHRGRSFGFSSGYVVFIDDHFTKQNQYLEMYQVPAFLKALLIRVSEIEHEYTSLEDDRLIHCLLDEIKNAPVQALNLPIPKDIRLKKITTTLIEQPELHHSLATWAKLICMSERNFTRLFKNETGLSVQQWRRQLHVLLALQWLSEGWSVHQIAEKLAYDSDSSFIVMFKKMMGISPKRYLEQHTIH